MPDIATLIETATDTSEGSFRRRMAVTDLARSKEPAAIAALIALMNDNDAYLRREVVSGLAKTEDVAVVEPLICALDDDDDYLQRDAAEALGRFGDRRALASLQKLLNDNSYSVRYAAERAMEKIEQRVPPPAATDDVNSATLLTTAATEPEAAAEAEPEASAEAEQKAEPEATPVAAEVSADVDREIVQATAVDISWVTETDDSRDLPRSPSPATFPSAAARSSSYAPSAPVASVAATRPAETIVTAALSTASSAGGLATPLRDTSPSPARVPAIRDWSAAKRFQAFFGDAVVELRERYNALAEAESLLLESERGYRQVLERLGDEESANRDGLARLEHGIDKAAKELAGMQRESNQKRREQQKLAREASTVSFQLASLLSSEKSRRNREAIGKLESAIARLDAVSAEVRTRQETLQRDYETQAAPLRELQRQAEELAASRTSGRQAVGDASEKINAWISGHLLRLPTEDLRSRIDALATSSASATVLSTCADELVKAVVEVEERSAESLDVEVALQEATTAAGASTDALGEAIAMGFRLTAIERKTNVRLSGSLRFTEDQGAFSGFSGVDGTAKGSGGGQAAYAVDEVQWAKSPEFDQHVRDFAETWAQCGVASARGELLRVMIAAGRHRAEDLARLIRTALEQDFKGGREG